MIENVSRLRMWIIFLIPKIEDGNNFGVGIQVSRMDLPVLGDQWIQSIAVGHWHLITGSYH